MAACECGWDGKSPPEKVVEHKGVQLKRPIWDPDGVSHTHADIVEHFCPKCNTLVGRRTKPL